MKDSPSADTTVSNATPRAEKRTNSVPLTAHLSLIGAATFWGLMSPLGKDAMTHGFDGIDMVSFRVAGGALLFWIASLFVPREAISRRDILWLCVAAVFGLVGNQCCFTVGLSLTSPINAGIATTSMPIFALVLSALVLREPVTWRKAVGVALGCMGALLLVWSSARAAGASVGTGNLRGDLLCLTAQFSYSIYLTVFGWLAKQRRSPRMSPMLNPLTEALSEAARTLDITNKTAPQHPKATPNALRRVMGSLRMMAESKSADIGMVVVTIPAFTGEVRLSPMVKQH